MGLEGEPSDISEESDESYGRVEAEEINWPLKDVIKHSSFWVLLITGAEHTAITTVVTFFIRDIGAPVGITALQSASLLSISSMVGFPVLLLSGLALDKIAAHKVLAFSFFTQAIFLIQMIYMNSMATATYVAIMWGLSAGLG